MDQALILIINNFTFGRWDSVNSTKNSIYIFPEMKLRGLFPNSDIHVSVSHLNIPRSSLPIYTVAAVQHKRQTNPGNISLTDICMWELGDRTL